MGDADRFATVLRNLGLAPEVAEEPVASPTELAPDGEPTRSLRKPKPAKAVRGKR